MARTTFTGYDLRTGQRLGVVPCVGTYRQKLNGAGDFFTTIDFGSGRNAGGYLDATRPRRTVIWVQRDNRLMDGYIVWARQWVRESRLLQIVGASIWSYFAHRRLRITRNYNNVDQLAIAKDLIDWAQAQPGGNIGVDTPANISGRLRTRNPIGYDFELKVISTLVEQLADVIDGFDFGIDASLVADVPTATFRTFYPRRGRTADANGITFMFGKNLDDIAHFEDETDRPNTVLGVGAGEGDTQLEAPAIDTAELDAGWPLLETSMMRKSNYDITTLADNAAGDLRRRQDSDRITIWVNPDHPMAQLGSWELGDDARILIPAGKHPRYPNGYDQPHRILEQAITPNPNGGPDIVALTLGAPRG